MIFRISFAAKLCCSSSYASYLGCGIGQYNGYCSCGSGQATSKPYELFSEFTGCGRHADCINSDAAKLGNDRKQ